METNPASETLLL